ncbi:MAG: alpha/beta fold hydrolase [Dissulfurispiraceae bacterium]
MLIDVLLLPGLLCNERLWVAQTKALAGLAHSSTLDLNSYKSIAAMADAILDKAPEQFALAGFSMGGCVALEIIARAPERVCRLALLSTNAGGLLPPVRQHLQNSIASIEAGGFDAYLVDAFPNYVAHERVQDHALWDTFAGMAKSLGPAVAVRQMLALLEYPGFKYDLGQISCTTAIICGREDQRTPVSVHKKLAEEIPAAKLSIIEHAGHFTPLEQPLAVTDALRDWLMKPTLD